MFSLPLLMYFRCYGNIKIPLTYNGKGKVKIGIYCFFIADILTNVFQNCLLSGPLPNIMVWF